jgi:chromosome partitioning protein
MNFMKQELRFFKTSLIDREAFRAIRSFGGTVNDLDPKQVSGIDKAVANAHALAVEVIERIKGIKREGGQKHD